MERLNLYRRQALASIGARARNPEAFGIACVGVSPHDLLKLVDAFEQLQQVATSNVSERSECALTVSLEG